MTKDNAYSRAFGVVLKRERIKQGLSQEELAYESNLDRTYVSGIERGRRKPTLEVARFIVLKGLRLDFTIFIESVEVQVRKIEEASSNV